MEQEQYDFYILGSLEDSQTEMAEERMHGRFPGEQETFDLTPIKASLMLRPKNSAEMSDVDRLLRQIVEDIASHQKHAKRLIEVVFHGKVCVDYMVSTNGGQVLLYPTTKTIFDGIKSHGGLVRTYAFERAMSLGALNWMLGDERYACDYSQFMWHMPHVDRSFQGEFSEGMLAGSVKMVREPMIRFFEQTPAGMPFAQRIRELEGEQELCLTGGELHAAGLTDKIFRNANEAKAHIASRTPWKFTQEDNDTMLGGQLWYELSQPTR